MVFFTSCVVMFSCSRRTISAAFQKKELGPNSLTQKTEEALRRTPSLEDSSSISIWRRTLAANRSFISQGHSLTVTPGNRGGLREASQIQFDSCVSQLSGSPRVGRGAASPWVEGRDGVGDEPSTNIVLRTESTEMRWTRSHYNRVPYICDDNV